MHCFLKLNWITVAMFSRTFVQKMALIKWMLASPCDRQDSQIFLSLNCCTFFWHHLYVRGKAMANYPQEQDAVCHSHTGHMTGLWFLPTRPLRLNTNEWMNECIHICGPSCKSITNYMALLCVEVDRPLSIYKLSYGLISQCGQSFSLYHHV